MRWPLRKSNNLVFNTRAVSQLSKNPPPFGVRFTFVANDPMRLLRRPLEKTQHSVSRLPLGRVEQKAMIVRIKRRCLH
jgi:hypothetical protein